MAKDAPVQAAPETDAEPAPQNDLGQAQLALFSAGLAELTPKEPEIFRCYVSGKRTAEIMEQLNIKENSLKYHNKNLYGKLGVSSRKQLIAVHRSYCTSQTFHP